MLSALMATTVGCSDIVPETPELPQGEAWTVNVSRTATDGQDLLVVLDNNNAITSGQLHPADTEDESAEWVGTALTWPASGSVKLTTFCPYQESLPTTVSSDAQTAYQVDYYLTDDAFNKVEKFTLTHLMAQLRVHIKVAENDTHPVPTDAVIRLLTTATVDYPNKTLTGATDAKDFFLSTFNKEEGKADGDDNWVNTPQIVIPQTLKKGERCIDFTAGGHDFHFTPERDIVLAPGRLTNIYLGVAMNQPDIPMMLEGVTVTDWYEGGTIVDGEAVEWVNGINTETGEYEPAQLNWDDYYEIKNAGNLFWFAQQVNDSSDPDNSELCAVLMADIDLENRPWTPIGNEGMPYKGHFDGNGHTITNFKQNPDVTTGESSLFGSVGESAVIKNYTINGSSDSNSTGDDA